MEGKGGEKGRPVIQLSFLYLLPCPWVCMLTGPCPWVCISTGQKTKNSTKHATRRARLYSAFSALSVIFFFVEAVMTLKRLVNGYHKSVIRASIGSHCQKKNYRACTHPIQADK